MCFPVPRRRVSRGWVGNGLGLGFELWGLGFRGWGGDGLGLGFGVLGFKGLGLGVEGLGWLGVYPLPKY